jgi:hypothetical protein
MDIAVTVFLRVMYALTCAALKLIVRLSVGCGNNNTCEISVFNESKLKSMQRL